METLLMQGVRRIWPTQVAWPRNDSASIFSSSISLEKTIADPQYSHNQTNRRN